MDIMGRQLVNWQVPQLGVQSQVPQKTMTRVVESIGWVRPPDKKKIATISFRCQGENEDLEIVLKHNFLRKLHVHSCIFI